MRLSNSESVHSNRFLMVEAETPKDCTDWLGACAGVAPSFVAGNTFRCRFTIRLALNFLLLLLARISTLEFTVPNSFRSTSPFQQLR